MQIRTHLIIIFLNLLQMWQYFFSHISPVLLMVENAIQNFQFDA